MNEAFIEIDKMNISKIIKIIFIKIFFVFLSKIPFSHDMTV